MAALTAVGDWYPELPERRGRFGRLSPAEFHCVTRKAQGFTEKDIARERGCERSTVSKHIERARKSMGFEDVQQLKFAFYAEYAPNLWSVPDQETP